MKSILLYGRKKTRDFFSFDTACTWNPSDIAVVSFEKAHSVDNIFHRQLAVMSDKSIFGSRAGSRARRAGKQLQRGAAHRGQGKKGTMHRCVGYGSTLRVFSTPLSRERRTGLNSIFLYPIETPATSLFHVSVQPIIDRRNSTRTIERRIFHPFSRENSRLSDYRASPSGTLSVLDIFSFRSTNERGLTTYRLANGESTRWKRRSVLSTLLRVSGNIGTVSTSLYTWRLCFVVVTKAPLSGCTFDPLFMVYPATSASRAGFPKRVSGFSAGSRLSHGLRDNYRVVSFC